MAIPDTVAADVIVVGCVQTRIQMCAFVSHRDWLIALAVHAAPVASFVPLLAVRLVRDAWWSQGHEENDSVSAPLDGLDRDFDVVVMTEQRDDVSPHSPEECHWVSVRVRVAQAVGAGVHREEFEGASHVVVSTAAAAA